MNYRLRIIASLMLGLVGRSVAGAPADPLVSASEKAVEIIHNRSEIDLYLIQNAADQSLISSERWKDLPMPDVKALALLTSRLPGIDTANVRAVPMESAEGMMQRAVDVKATYLDLLTEPALRKDRQELFYVSQDVLQKFDAKYAAGSFPSSGKTKDGKPYQMLGILAGEGSITFLYDQTGEFIFVNDGVDIKIAAGGKVVSTINGPSDLSTTGVSGCMRVGFYFCAEIQRTTKVSDGKVIIETSRGPQNRDIKPISLR